MVYQSTVEGDLVVDPFFGSGSAGVAALELKRNFMGSDISKDAHELANEKLSVLGECVNVKNSAKFEESTLEISKIEAVEQKNLELNYA